MTSRSTDQADERVHQTRFLGLAIFLSFQGHDLLHTTWNEGKCSWSFRESPSLLRDVEEFDSGEARVNPRDYLGHVTDFKRKMYEQKSDALTT